MNIKDILSSDEKVLFSAGQHRLAPGGKELMPGKIYVSDKRIILETTAWAGLKHEYIDVHFSDVMNVDLHHNVFSSDVSIQTRFQGSIHIKSIGHKEAEQLDRLVSQKIDSYRYGAGSESKRDDSFGGK
jgi:hypothetical protein